MKINPAGNKLVTAVLFSKKFEILNFNNITGEIEYLFEIDFAYPVYGCEFSPDGSKLYMTSQYQLYQVDLNAGTPDDIINSLTEIYEFDNPLGALQLASDGKIYVSPDTSDFLSVINEPNQIAEFCDFEYNAIYLDGRKARLGLPNFIQSYFIPPVFSVQNVCYLDETLFSIETLPEPDSVFWNFGDIETGNLNFSREFSPVHIFSETGLYYVILEVWLSGISYTYSDYINIVKLPEIDLGKDTVFCILDSYTLNIGDNHLSYLWNDFSTDSVLYIDTSGTYSVLVTNIYTTCQNSDSVNIVFSDVPEIDLGNDTSFCRNTSLLIDAFHNGYTYLWQDNSTESFFLAENSGSYDVTVENMYGCVNSDTVNLTLINNPVFEFPADTVLCENTVLNLIYDFEDTQYIWQDGTTENSFLVTEAGNYSLTTQNVCDSWTDSIQVSYKYCGNIYIPNVFTPNDDEFNHFFKIKGIENETWNLTVYNRWGQKIIYYNTYDNSWTGKDQNGQILSSGVYYYYLFNPVSGERYQGTIRIIR
jgi:gliding motility-associated-like protein